MRPSRAPRATTIGSVDRIAGPQAGFEVSGLSTTAQAAWRSAMAEPDQLLVVLDYDGTLAPIVADPEQARPEPGALDVLARLAHRVARVAIVTGRPVHTLVHLAGLDALIGSRLVVLGAYGTESWDARTGQYEVPDPGPAIARARARLRTLVDQAPAGTWLEDKGRAVAIHTRRAGDPAGVFGALRPAVEALAAELGLGFEPGRAVLEVREPGADKGDAVRRLVAESSPRVLVYVGDDLGDIPAFTAAAGLRAGGVAALRVGVASPEREWPEGLVDVLVDGPAGVLDLLRMLAAGDEHRRQEGPRG